MLSKLFKHLLQKS